MSAASKMDFRVSISDELAARMPAREFFALPMRSLPMDDIAMQAYPTLPDIAVKPGLDPTIQLVLHGRGSPRREELEAFISTEYRQHFGANITEFMPTFLAVHDKRDRICAAVGCRSAALESLFLEVYTNKPIERLIAERLAVHVPRQQIVEIGSLACRDGRAAMSIIRALVPYLIDAGFSWVTFTGADTVVKVLRHLNLKPCVLCVADSAMLGSARFDWGSYYDHGPVVMAGRLLDGVHSLESLPSVQ
jgi:hypothetical protein